MGQVPYRYKRREDGVTVDVATLDDWPEENSGKGKQSFSGAVDIMEPVVELDVLVPRGASRRYRFMITSVF